MTAVYDDYGPDRVGFFFGLTGSRLAALTLAVIPVFVGANQQRWLLTGQLAAIAVVVTVLVVVPSAVDQHRLAAGPLRLRRR